MSLNLFSISNQTGEINVVLEFPLCEHTVKMLFHRQSITMYRVIEYLSSDLLTLSVSLEV